MRKNSLHNKILFFLKQFWVLIPIVVLCLVLLLTKQRKKNERYDYEYDYDRENPNALVSGSIVAGTVWVTDKSQNTGLGWVV